MLASSGAGAISSHAATATQAAAGNESDDNEEELGTIYIVLDQCQRLVDAAVPVAHDGGVRSLVRVRMVSINRSESEQ